MHVTSFMTCTILPIPSVSATQQSNEQYPWSKCTPSVAAPCARVVIHNIQVNRPYTDKFRPKKLFPLVPQFR